MTERPQGQVCLVEVLVPGDAVPWANRPGDARDRPIPPRSGIVPLGSAGTLVGPSLNVPTETRMVTAVRFLASKSASTHMGGSRLSSVAGLPFCSPQLFTSHLIGAPPPSFLRKNSRVTFGKLRSNDDTIRLCARRIAAFTVLLVDDGCAHKQTVSRTQKPRMICRMPLLDTSRLREAHTFGEATRDSR